MYKILYILKCFFFPFRNCRRRFVVCHPAARLNSSAPTGRSAYNTEGYIILPVLILIKVGRGACARRGTLLLPLPSRFSLFSFFFTRDTRVVSNSNTRRNMWVVMGRPLIDVLTSCLCHAMLCTNMGTNILLTKKCEKG